MVKTPPCHGEDPGSIPGDGANFTNPPIPQPLTANRYPLSPILYPLSLMSHLYRFSINPASSLPPSLQSYAHLSWISYTVFPDGSIFAEMPDGCLMVEANSPYRAA
ncbi:MAG: hypothetical protein RI978_1245 [Verrucomicrobiota bacterium]